VSKYRKADADASIAELFQRNPALAAENPHLLNDASAVTRRDAALLQGARCEAPASAPVNELAARFEALWRRWEGPDLEREYRFSPARRWRADYCHLPTRTLIELEGGIFSGGRHTRAAGFAGDCDKYNAAAMLGYTVLRLATGQVDDAHVGEIADWVRRKTKEVELCSA
jgi:very-short-patch-repair endonuclease